MKYVILCEPARCFWRFADGKTAEGWRVFVLTIQDDGQQFADVRKVSPRAVDALRGLVGTQLSDLYYDDRGRLSHAIE